MHRHIKKLSKEWVEKVTKNSLIDDLSKSLLEIALQYQNSSTISKFFTKIV